MKSVQQMHKEYDSELFTLFNQSKIVPDQSPEREVIVATLAKIIDKVAVDGYRLDTVNNCMGLLCGFVYSPLTEEQREILKMRMEVA